jgi:hypothetical protein
MPLSFAGIVVGNSYSRQELVELSGYAGTEALHRGVVTPRADNKIILFVTQNKDPEATPYQDRLVDDTLEWEGPNDHFAEDRIINAETTNDQIHLFHRMNPNEKFTYQGLVDIVSADRRTDSPSRFTFRKHSK